MKREFQISFLKSAGLKPEHRLLDLGCGTLRGGLPMIAYLDRGHYTGIEAREDVLAEGRKELAESGLKGKAPVLLHTNNPNELEVSTRFDFVWAFSVLIHMTDEILFDTLKFVSQVIADDGLFYANVNLGTRENGLWQGFPVVWRELLFYRQAGENFSLVVTDIGSIRELGHRSGDPHQDRQRMLQMKRRVPYEPFQSLS